MGHSKELFMIQGSVICFIFLLKFFYQVCIIFLTILLSLTFWKITKTNLIKQLMYFLQKLLT